MKMGSYRIFWVRTGSRSLREPGACGRMVWCLVPYRHGGLVKITTHIDGRLLRQTRRESGARSQREVIEEGLRNLLADARRKRFVKECDRFRISFDLKELRLRRA
jgi:hypothetical protein